MTLPTLIERLEAAESGNPDLDAAIAVEIGPSPERRAG